MISSRYVLFNRIPIYEDRNGNLYAGDLWAQDLLRHLDYIQDFHLCCPLQSVKDGPEHLVRLIGFEKDRLYPLRRDVGWRSVFTNLLPNFLRVAAATKAGGIMHSGGAGWPFPLSYYLLILRIFHQFRWLMLIESTFWMLPKEGQHSLRKRIVERAHRWMISRCLARANARIFTQDWYRETLFRGTRATLIAPASWIEESNIKNRPRDGRAPGSFRLLFPSRMTAEKGVGTVLDAIKAYEALPEAANIALDVVGQGELSDAVDTTIANHSGRISLRRLPMQPYGAPFFALLQDYDAVLVANRTEEQPRLIFDAFSQGVPCLYSGTHGNVSIAEDGRTGWQFKPGDATALAILLARAADDLDGLTAMGEAALSVARKHTHTQMHRTREKFLKDVFGQGA